MADSGDNVVGDCDEFEFNPSEWMVLDADNEVEDDNNGSDIDNSVGEGSGGDSKGSGRSKNERGRQSAVSGGRIRSNTSDSYVSGNKDKSGNIQASESTTKKGTISRPEVKPTSSNSSTIVKADKSTIDSNSNKCKQKASKGSKIAPGKTVDSIADALEKLPSTRKGSSTAASKNSSRKLTVAGTTSRAVTRGKSGSASTSTSSASISTSTSAAKRKAEGDSLISPPAKSLKHGAEEKSQSSSKDVTTVQTTGGQNQISSPCVAQSVSTVQKTADHTPRSSQRATESTSIVQKNADSTPRSSRHTTKSVSSVPHTGSSHRARSSSSSSKVSPNLCASQSTSTKSGSKVVATAPSNKSPSTATPSQGDRNTSSTDDSIAEAMGVKISDQPMTGLVVTDEDMLEVGTQKTTGDNGSTTSKHTKIPNASSTTLPVSGTNSVKDVVSSGTVPSATIPGLSKKRIIRRFHRSIQTTSQQVSHKLLQCLIPIPRLDWPGQEGTRCDIGVMAAMKDDAATTTACSVTSVAVKADSVAEDSFHEALRFGTAQGDGSGPPKPVKDYGLRFIPIQHADTGKVQTNIRKADGYRLEFPSKDSGTLDLFYHEEEGLLQTYNYFRKNRLGQRHVCVSIHIPPVPRTKDKDGIPACTATVVFDQNFANSGFVAYSKAPSVWMKPKADVFVSVHNVPKDVPLSLMCLIFPDAVSVEMDDPNLKVTKDTSNRVKLGLPRKALDKFLSLFVQVVINNTPLVLTSGLTQEEDVPEMKALILERKKRAEQARQKQEDENGPTLIGVPRDINKDKKKPESGSGREPEMVMQVEDVKCIDKVLTGRPGAWKGPSTAASLRLKTKPVSKESAQKNDPKSDAAATTSVMREDLSDVFREDLSDISDDSDVGQGWPDVPISAGVTAKHLTGYSDSDISNRWQNKQPPNTTNRYNREERDFSRGVGGGERIVAQSSNRSRQAHHDRQPPFPPSQHVDNLKVCVSNRSDGGGSGEGDLRGMLDTLKSRRSSWMDDNGGGRFPMDVGVTRSVSPSNSSNQGHRRSNNESQEYRRSDRDRRVVRTSTSPGMDRRQLAIQENRDRNQSSSSWGNSSLSPSSGRGRQQNVAMYGGRQSDTTSSFKWRNSLSPPSRRRQRNSQSPDRIRQNRTKKRSPSPRNRASLQNRSLSPKRRNRLKKRSLSPRDRSRQKRSLSPINKQTFYKRSSLSPILPFRPGIRNSNKDMTKDVGQDSGLFRLDSNKARVTETRRPVREREEEDIEDQKDRLAASKNLYNTLMERLREKANVYSVSQDSNLQGAASIYQQINQLAQALTAIRHDSHAVKRFASLLAEGNADMEDIHSLITSITNEASPSNNNRKTDLGNPPPSSSSQLHPDLLRYVNVRSSISAASNNSSNITNTTAISSNSNFPTPTSTSMASSSSSTIPPPIPPPLFTGDSPTDKQAQLQAIAKQLVADLKSRQQGGGAAMQRQPPSSVSDGVWMVPPPLNPSVAPNMGPQRFEMAPASGPPLQQPGPMINPAGGPGLLQHTPPPRFSMPPPPVPMPVPAPINMMTGQHMQQPPTSTHWNTNFNNNNNNGVCRPS